MDESVRLTSTAKPHNTPRHPSQNWNEMISVWPRCFVTVWFSLSMLTENSGCKTKAFVESFWGEHKRHFNKKVALFRAGLKTDWLHLRASLCRGNCTCVYQLGYSQHCSSTLNEAQDDKRTKWRSFSCDKFCIFTITWTSGKLRSRFFMVLWNLVFWE